MSLPKSKGKTKNNTPHTTTTYRSLPHLIARLPTTAPTIIHLRDGEVVVYRRSRSLLYQCRFKLADGKWHRYSTGRASVENAIARACEMYDEARFRQRMGLAHRTHSFAQIAAITLQDLRKRMDASTTRTSYHDYASCIERYFLPYFKDYRLEDITAADIRAFEQWRDKVSNRTPKHSTLQNFASAWNRIINTAIDNGYISERATLPRLTTKGQASNPRPAFSKDEIDTLLAFMQQWRTQGKVSTEHEMRPLLCDYVEILLHTGIRHGTEAMNLCWHHIHWHTDKGVRYLRLWVSGKTGGRWLIARHAAVDVFRRLHSRQRDLDNVSFDDIFTERCTKPVFRFSTGYQPPNLNGAFGRLMRDSGLLRDIDGKKRTLYSLRHTYATLALLTGDVDIHTLARQMGNSVLMLERHYSKLTATMAAERLA